MTTSVVDKTPIADHVYRRHTDPPSLWIVVAISSVSLHLLAFWLLRSLHVIGQGFSHQEQADIPIELVEISPQAKPIAPNRSINRNPQATNLPKQAAPTDNLTVKSDTPEILDQRTIASASEKRAIASASEKRAIASASEKRAIASASEKRAIVQQRELEQAQQRQREQFERQQQLEQAQQQRQREQFERQQQIEQAQQQRQREQFERQQQIEQAQQQRQREQAEQQRQREQAENTNSQESSPQTPRDEPVNNNTQEPSSQTPNPPVGSLLASLVGQPQQTQVDRHIHPAKIKPSNQPFSKGLEYIQFIEREPGKPVEFSVILTISEKGKLERIRIEDEAIPADERTSYEQFVADQVFKDWQFEPAYDNDPNDPKPSDLIIRIRIQPVS